MEGIREFSLAGLCPLVDDLRDLSHKLTPTLSVDMSKMKAAEAGLRGSLRRFHLRDMSRIDQNTHENRGTLKATRGNPIYPATELPFHMTDPHD